MTKDYLTLIKQFVRSNTVYGRIFLLGRTRAVRFEVLVVRSEETATHSAAFTTVLYMKLVAVLKLPAGWHVQYQIVTVSETGVRRA